MTQINQIYTHQKTYAIRILTTGDFKAAPGWYASYYQQPAEKGLINVKALLHMSVRKDTPTAPPPSTGPSLYIDLKTANFVKKHVQIACNRLAHEAWYKHNVHREFMCKVVLWRGWDNML